MWTTPAAEDYPHDIHVVPHHDLREHFPNRTCWCRPFEDDDEPRVWHHKAMDRREQHEGPNGLPTH